MKEVCVAGLGWSPADLVSPSPPQLSGHLLTCHSDSQGVWYHRRDRGQPVEGGRGGRDVPHMTQGTMAEFLTAFSLARGMSTPGTVLSQPPREMTASCRKGGREEGGRRKEVREEVREEGGRRWGMRGKQTKKALLPFPLTTAYASLIISTQSAIQSREISEYLIPAQPMVSPSLMTGVPHKNPFPEGRQKKFSY